MFSACNLVSAPQSFDLAPVVHLTAERRSHHRIRILGPSDPSAKDSRQAGRDLFSEQPHLDTRWRPPDASALPPHAPNTSQHGPRYPVAGDRTGCRSSVGTENRRPGFEGMFEETMKAVIGVCDVGNGCMPAIRGHSPRDSAAVRQAVCGACRSGRASGHRMSAPRCSSNVRRIERWQRDSSSQ